MFSSHSLLDWPSSEQPFNAAQLLLREMWFLLCIHALLVYYIEWNFVHFGLRVLQMYCIFKTSNSRFVFHKDYYWFILCSNTGILLLHLLFSFVLPMNLNFVGGVEQSGFLRILFVEASILFLQLAQVSLRLSEGRAQTSRQQQARLSV
ncbi:hypothetical protein QOT17_015829 [Balamuthia mandrillaris]